MPNPWESFDFDPSVIPVLTAKMRDCKYELGAKAPSLEVQLADIKEIDCSGFVRIITYKASGTILPDGSFMQGRWFEENNFKVSDTASCKLHDGVLRLLWMTPHQGGGVGHIAFCLNAKTYESYGGHGPGSRPFTGASKFQRVSKVFVLAYPKR